jgi:hypothetical protein
MHKNKTRLYSSFSSPLGLPVVIHSSKVIIQRCSERIDTAHVCIRTEFTLCRLNKNRIPHIRRERVAYPLKDLQHTVLLSRLLHSTRCHIQTGERLGVDQLGRRHIIAVVLGICDGSLAPRRGGQVTPDTGTAVCTILNYKLCIHIYIHIHSR